MKPGRDKTAADALRPIPWLGRAGVVEPIDKHLELPRELTVRRTGASRPPTGRRRLPVLAARAPSAAGSAGGCGCAKKAQAPAGNASGACTGSTRTTGAGGPGGDKSEPASKGAGPTAPPTPQRKKERPGSGIPARKSIRVLQWARRVSQTLFFLLFAFLLCETTFRGSFAAKAEQAVRMRYPVEAFLLFDPFVAVMTFLSTHAVYRGLLWALVLLGLTLVFGRVFCGWICPFGTMHHFFAWIFPSRYGRGSSRVDANRTHGYQRIKYYLLYAFLAAALAGSAIGGVFDPICIAVRALGLFVIPGLQYIVGHGLLAAAGLNERHVQAAADTLQEMLAHWVWQPKQFYFHQTWLIGFLLVGVLFMNRFIPRFWCRVLCPLGAFLGAISKYALFGMEKDHTKCTDCNLCLVHCQGADSPQGGIKWRQDECHMCMNCENACPEDVIKFRFLPNWSSREASHDAGRRTSLASLAAGAIAIPTARIADSLDTNYDSRLIRPPGAVEEHAFLDRCIRCAECMKVCPNNALHPSLFEGGIEGLWTPILIARIGYCEPSCVLCGQVCPTGAIQKITEREKLGQGVAPVKIGTAFYDHGRCLPWSMQTPCIVCEEFCPTSPKAIWVEEVETEVRSSEPGKDGEPPAMNKVKLQRPHVDPKLCIGCGACEKVCPVQDRPAVYVTSIGETRSKTNVILLENTKYDA